MIDHSVKWPEIGIGAESEDDNLEEWMEHPKLRMVLFVVSVAADILHLVITGLFAFGLVVAFDSTTAGIPAGTATFWYFVAAVITVMLVDYLLPFAKISTIYRISHYITIKIAIVFIELYLTYKHAQRNIQSPSEPTSVESVVLPRIGLSRGKDRIN